MSLDAQIDRDRIRRRQTREDLNLFSRLPAVYSSSRKQGQQLLQLGGGLSIVEWRTLWDLHEAGPMTIRDLSALQRTDHSLLSRALPEMKRKGYVQMERSSEDGRQTIVALTEQGLQAYQTAAPIMARRRAMLRQVFSEDEIRAFAGLLDRLEEFLHLPVDEILNAEAAE
ncbi:MarR family winged helix-turn-helix transcriptional regulator [Pseudooceanicola sp. MF1-13]|uniref:MarR family winged helix-turn-helix transcriptional regulator n=1 Tax=Pseudooceanicola sp. MF1-13 TaxID=3379095 RepID=UPI00389236F4